MSPLLSLICVIHLGFEGDLIPGAEFKRELSLSETGNSTSLLISEEDPQLEVTMEYSADNQIKIKVLDLLSDSPNKTEIDSLQFSVKPILYITSLKGPFTFGVGDDKRPINQISLDCTP